MSSFLYYLPGSSEVIGRERLESAGLLSRVPLKTMQLRGIRANGPDGGAGMIVMGPSVGEAPLIGYFPDQQIWAQSADGLYWLGLDPRHMPGPNELQRAEMIAGHEVELGDGNHWLIPVGRLFIGGTRFEKRLRLGPDGKWVSEVLPQYRELVDRAEQIHRYLVEEDGTATIDDREAIELAVKLLSLNYHMSRDEVSALGLLTDRNVSHILEAFVDAPTIVAVGQELVAAAEAQKKTVQPEGQPVAASIPDGSNSGSGATD